MESEDEVAQQESPVDDELSEEEASVAWFTDADRLKLIQLQCLKACAAQQSAVAEQTAPPSDDEATSRVEGDEPPSSAAWRLLPSGSKLHPWQEQALERWLETRRGTLQVATGAGKTWFALALMERLQRAEPDLRVAIVVPTIALMNQWYTELTRGSLPPQWIARAGDRHLGRFGTDTRILITVLATARDHLSGLVGSPDVAQHLLLVVDECHRVETDRARRIFECNPAYTLGLSATPGREDEGSSLDPSKYAATLTGQKLGPIFFTLNLRQALEADLLTPFRLEHIGLPLDKDERARYEAISRALGQARKTLREIYSRRKSSQPFEQWVQTVASRQGPGSAQATEYVSLQRQRKRLLYHCKARHDVSLALLREAVDRADSQTILFHESLEPVNRLYYEALQAGMPVVLEHSKVPSSVREESVEAYRSGLARAILSGKTLIEGFNVPSADVGIVAAATTGIRQRVQTLGRLLRKKAEGREAIIYILYCSDTTDEVMYEKFDQEAIVGGMSSRYYRWETTEDESWRAGLVELEGPPKLYVPLPEQVDARRLQIGSRYPGRAEGEDIKIDADLNLRRNDGTLVPNASELIDRIIRYNPVYRRGRVTRNGHVIVLGRPADEPEETRDVWLFAGLVGAPSDRNVSARVEGVVTAHGSGAMNDDTENVSGQAGEAASQVNANSDSAVGSAIGVDEACRVQEQAHEAAEVVIAAQGPDDAAVLPPNPQPQIVSQHSPAPVVAPVPLPEKPIRATLNAEARRGESAAKPVTFQMKSHRGNRRIARTGSSGYVVAIGPEGLEKRLLATVAALERTLGLTVHKVYFDSGRYWVEAKGDKHVLLEDQLCLEFPKS